MPGANLLALLDDIATVLDDVALMTKVAAKKTAGVLGDDLALNAEQVAGVSADRELPVVWAVAKGSLKNKAILVPSALAISALLPWAVTPLLMLGGLYLCFEGVEKLAHKLLHRGEPAGAPPRPAAVETAGANAASEREKISGAVRTDFILSAEIITITLGTVAQSKLQTQVAVLCLVALLMTVGVYGLVAAIVKLDDAGLALARLDGRRPAARALRALGGVLLRATPWVMRSLGVAGTVAMFLVGGGILVHGVPPLHTAIEHSARTVGAWPTVGGALAALLPLALDAVVGIAAGTLALAGVRGVQRLRPGNSQ